MIMKQKLGLLLVIFCTILLGQEKKKWVRYSGNIGARFESNISDLDYLPGAYASTYFNVNISAGLIGLNLNGELSTADQRFSPEVVKKLGISPTIGFLHLDIGDHYPNYSKYVMSGAKIRGLSAMIDPGNFIFGMTGGRVRVGGANKEGEYRREAYGLQLGMKSKKFELITKFSRLNDLPSAIDSLYLPQESLTAGLTTKMIFPGNIRIQGEAGYSFHTRNKQAEQIDSTFGFDEYSLEDLGLKPRLSSRLDYAYNYTIFVPIKALHLSYSRDFIGPGFQTLGTPYMKNDVLKDMFRAGLNLFNGRFFTNVIYMMQENNLNGEKDKLTSMDNLSISTRIKPLQFFGIRARYAQLERSKKSSDRPYSFDKNSYNISPEFTFKTGGLQHKFSAGYGQSISDYNDREYETANIRLRYNGRLESGYSFFADMNHNDYGTVTRKSYSVGGGKRFGRNANLRLSVGLADQLESNISGFVMLPWKFRLRGMISYFRMDNYNLKFRINLQRNF